MADEDEALSDLKCESCGSTQLRQDSNGLWHCLFCRATFRANRPMMIVVDSPEVQQADEVVIDTADLLTFDQQKAVSDHLARIREDHDVVVAVETVNTITENVEFYARSRAQELGVGDDAKDNGIYILMVRSPRRVQVQAGNGIAQHLGGGDIDRIVRERFVPAFKRGDLVAGLTEGADALVATYEQNRSSGSAGQPGASGGARPGATAWGSGSSSSRSRSPLRFAGRDNSWSGLSDAGERRSRSGGGFAVLWVAVIVIGLFLLMTPGCGPFSGSGSGGGTSDSGWTSDDTGWGGGGGDSGWDSGGGGGGSFDGGDFDGGSGGGSDW